MTTILGLIGSPRPLGNSEIMVKEISRNLERPHQLKLIRLPEFNILPCKGCYMCLFGRQRCVQKDDFESVLTSIVEADALLVAAPTYFLGVNASLKRLLDRGLAFYAHIESLWGKPSVGVGIAGIEGKEGYTLLGIDSFLKMLLTDTKQTRIIYGALPGEIFLNQTNREVAAELARRLFQSTTPRTTPHCNVCGGDTFRFLGRNQVRCMLCSNSGTMRWKVDDPVFDIHSDAHPMFSSKADAIAHREWLIGMKDRFIQHKKALKEITLPYRKQGEWINCP